MVDRQPLGRLGRPEEIAAAIRYLASPEAGFVHGSCLVIDGGFLAR
jgi:NAD(P)-dependent dehydrogenase (short-subunit alcohol dehydrogenase family)